ncbi:hypothetical protein M316_0142 [Nitrincola phage 1M3-16]|uniref:hypothetical protein n=1 Tax=Nitrincola phage 1M3-16 TaxID=1472912 RepID=UPI000444CA75|nr:hypothetical protein GJ22_gp010 [Nitrincola phage 1M3-16]AHX01207.1 hypothetical protein M316_0142 [Nitrincola phage 1M3-16]
MNLSKEAIEVCVWLRDNPHHYSSWEPQSEFPNCEYMLVRGDGCEIKIPVKVNFELNFKMVYNVEGHIFYPNDEVIKYLEELGV